MGAYQSRIDESNKMMDKNKKNICSSTKECKNIENTGFITCPNANCSNGVCKCGKNCVKMTSEQKCCRSIVKDENNNEICCKGKSSDNDLCPIWNVRVPTTPTRKPPKGFCGFSGEPVFENGRWKCKDYFNNIEAFTNERMYAKF